MKVGVGYSGGFGDKAALIRCFCDAGLQHVLRKKWRLSDKKDSSSLKKRLERKDIMRCLIRRR